MSLRIEQFFVRFLVGTDGGGVTQYGEGIEEHSDSDHSDFGVHVLFSDIYYSVVYLACIYVAGQIASKLLRMPPLVGEIIAGIILGPPLADFVPLPEAWVLLGEIGLLLLVIEAGIDIDINMLKLIGGRGVTIAFFGSIFPIGIGIMIGIVLGLEAKAAIAAGACFGPTSLGIALNILRTGGILNTPVGQLIVAAAVIDDMIALVILSQLSALTGDITVAGVVIPIVSALLYLIVGGLAAIFILPVIINKYILVKFSPDYHARVELTILFGLLLALMPATYYSKASFLMGAFISGLTFCSSHDLHHLFVSQFKRVLQWLMRIFFASTIGFQVPVKEFGDGMVIWQGLVFTLALLGKIGVGFMVPNFTQARSFTGIHFRDCLITGFSMAAEGEFAFVLAVFAVDSDLISKQTYSSVVLAVLLSTIFPPFGLRWIIGRYNKKAEDVVRKAAEDEMGRGHDLESYVEITPEQREEQLRAGIKNQTTVFLCIQTQSEARWGLMHNIMSCLYKLQLEIIDHRSWHPRGVNTTLVNEVYVRCNLKILQGMTSHQALDEQIKKVQEALTDVIDQPETAKVKVTRWYPGVITEIVDETEENVKTKPSTVRATLEDRLLEEATSALEQKQQIQTMATTQKSIKELLRDMSASACPQTDVPMGGEASPSVTVEPIAEGTKAQYARKKRVRHKMRSTPVFGGSLFGEDSGNAQAVSSGPVAPRVVSSKKKDEWRSLLARPTGHSAELTINGESYQIRISDDTLKNLRKGFSGETLDSRGFTVPGHIQIEQANAPIVNMLQGYVRNTKLASIKEGSVQDTNSEANSEDVENLKEL